MLYLVHAVIGVCCIWCMLYLVYAVFGVCCNWCMLYLVYAVIGVCCIWCMLYLVYAVFGVCCIWYMLYLVYAVFGVCYSWCMLYSTYALNSVSSSSCHGKIGRDDLPSCSAIMVELWMRKRDEGWRWERYGQYTWIQEHKSMTCPIGFGWPYLGAITSLIGTYPGRICYGKLIRTCYSLSHSSSW